MNKKSKAVSTMVANLLVLAIIVSVGTSIYAWTVAGYGNYQSQVGSFLSSRTDVAKERYIIEQIWFNDTDSDTKYEKIKLFIRNVGEIPISIMDASVNGTQGSTTSPTLPLAFDLDQVKTIEITVTQEISKGALTQIDLVSERGHPIRSYWQAE